MLTNSPWNDHGDQILDRYIKQQVLHYKVVILNWFNEITTKSLMSMNSCLVHGFYLLDYTV